MSQKIIPPLGPSLSFLPHSSPQDIKLDPSAPSEPILMTFFLEGVVFPPSLLFFYPVYNQEYAICKASLYYQGSPGTQNATLILMGTCV